ncbi:unnamed protein product, partial [Phaeothamnion confervicola]
PFIAHGDSSSKPIILIPGLDGCTSFFDNTIPELKDEYYVLVFEIPLIEPPRTQARADRERPYDFSFFAWYLSEAMTKAGVARAPIVGESFGGFIAQRLAFDFPDRVEMLILLSSMAKAELTAAVRFKLCFVLPCVETLGLAAPRVAQRLFAVFHASDVVESHEPAWLREFFVKEASAADHYSVMARVRLAVAWDSTDEVRSSFSGFCLGRHFWGRCGRSAGWSRGAKRVCRLKGGWCGGGQGARNLFSICSARWRPARCIAAAFLLPRLLFWPAPLSVAKCPMTLRFLLSAECFNTLFSPFL